MLKRMRSSRLLPRVVFAGLAIVVILTGLASAISKEPDYLNSWRQRVPTYAAIGIGLGMLVGACWPRKSRDADPKPRRTQSRRPAERQGSAVVELPGRNDECLCGSGLKFKKCCLHRIEEARRASRASTSVNFDLSESIVGTNEP